MKLLKLNQLKILSASMALVIASFGNVNAQNSIQKTDASIAVVDDTQQETPPVLGISDITNNKLAVSVFPNPCKNNAYIKVENVQPGDIYVFVYDLTGKEISRATYNNISANMTLDLKQSGSGIYFLKVLNGSTSITQKIINE